MTEQITSGGLILAIIIRAGFKREGVEFFTPNEFSQQLGYMNRPEGYKVEPHTHKRIEGNVVLTNEVLYVKSGKIKVSLYDKDNRFFQERTINCGDIILLATGGHSIEMVEDTELIEIKQGPASGGDDKINFTPVKNNND